MNDHNLIPITNKKQARELGIKGGSVKSPAKTLAARLRELKKKGLSNETAKKFYELMVSSGYTDLEILTHLYELKSKSQTPKEKEAFLKLELEWRKLHHGTNTKLEVTSTNISFNLDAPLSKNEYDNLMCFLKERESKSF